MTPDVHFKKTIPLRYAGTSLEFRVSQRLFSSHQIDRGSLQLLQSLVSHQNGGFETVLDVGSGYGPLGLSLVKSGIAKSAHLVDRDALAVEYSRQNAALNGIDDIEVYGSLGYSDVSRHEFDLIVMNVPGKAGDEVIESLLLGARQYLSTGGLVAAVIVKPLGDLAKEILGSDPGVTIEEQGDRAGYSLFHYRFSPTEVGEPGDDDDLEPYTRDEIEVFLPHADYRLIVARGLPEFEAPGHSTQLLIEGLQAISISEPASVTVLNPGQGHLPVALVQLVQPGQIELVGSDLLALRYSERNLVLNGLRPENIRTFHRVGLSEESSHEAQLITGLLRGDENAAEAKGFANELSDQIVPGGYVAVAGSSTAITRLESAARENSGLAVETRKKRRGSSLLVLRGK